MTFTVKKNIRRIRRGLTVSPHQLPYKGGRDWFAWSNLGPFEDLHIKVNLRTLEAEVIRHVWEPDSAGDGDWVPTPATLEDLPADLILYHF